MGQYYRACYKAKGFRKYHSLGSCDYHNGAKLMDHSYVGNEFVEGLMDLIFKNPMRIVWAGDYADDEKGKDNNLYELSIREKRPNKVFASREYKYIVNHTKHLYIDLSKGDKDNWGYIINPLPILTAEGNGRGGGDYCGTDMENVGTWARDFISVDNEFPTDFKEFVSQFKEGE